MPFGETGGRLVGAVVTTPRWIDVFRKVVPFAGVDSR